MVNERKLSEVNDGRMANILASHLEPLFQSLEQEKLSEMKQLYRAGECDLVKLQVALGGLVTIEDLRVKIKMQINRGESAKKELLK